MKFTNYLLFVFVCAVFLGCSSDDNSDTILVNTDPDPILILSSDLELFLSVSNATPEVDTNITFTILVSNNSLDAATDIVIEDILPDSYTYIEDNSDSAYNQNNGLWSISNLGASESTSLNITVKVNASGNYTNVAEIVASSNEDPDSVPNNGILTEDDQDSISINPIIASTVNVSTIAVLNAADALAIDGKQCILYASSYGQSKVYTIGFDGTVTTFLTNQPGAAGIDFDTENNLYLARYASSDIVKRDPTTGNIEIFASGIAAPIALDFDSNENLYTNNNVNNAITKIDPSGNKTIIGVNVFNNSSLAVDAADNIYVSDYNSGEITKIDATTNKQSIFTNIPIINGGIGYIIYSNNYFYATAIADGTVFQIDSDGNAELIAGIPGVSGTTDGDSNTATFHNPIGIVATMDGNTLYVAQNGGEGAIRVITGFND